MRESFSIPQARLEEIPFARLVDYWKETDHFLDPNKIYTEVLSHLGPFHSTYADPRRISYGLFLGPEMIAATHITEWTPLWIRFRTINVRERYRGQDLAWQVLRAAVSRDWSDSKALFGWFRRSAYSWATQHGFQDVDGVWYGEHRAVQLALPLP